MELAAFKLDILWYMHAVPEGVVCCAVGGDGVTKPGERRIRREVWMKQADNKFEVW